MKRGGAWIVLSVALLAALAGAGWTLRARFERPASDRGSAAYAAGKWDAALHVARERLKKAPDDRDALRMYARASLRLGHEEQARSIYGKLGGTKGMEAEDLFLLGRLLRDKGETEMAEQCWTQGLDRDANNAPLLLELARLDLESERFERAAEMARRLREQPAYQSQSDFVLGDVRAAQGDLDAAVESWDAAFKHAPRAADVAAHRKPFARALLGLGRPREARALLAQAAGDAVDPETDWLMSRGWLQEGDLARASQALASGRSYRDEHPVEPEPAPYVGAARCGECHREIYQHQQHSLHGTTFARGAALSDDLLTQGPVPDPVNRGREHTVSRRDGSLQFESRQGDAVYRAIVDYAFGSGKQGITLLGHDESQHIRECRLSRYVHGSSWDVTTGQPHELPADDDGLGRVLSADDRWQCIVCHTTDARSALLGRGVTASEHGIGCERCHGPGAHHLKAVVAGPDKFDDLSIAKPTRGRADEVLALCRDCHTLRGGQKVLPEDRKSIRFPATTLTWSRCYTESNGALDCLTCHEPHREAEPSGSYYDSKCLSCHGKAEGSAGAAAADRRDASKRHVQASPCPVNPLTGCRSCHMPDVNGIIPHSPVTDHHIRIHPQRREHTAALETPARSTADRGSRPTSSSE